VHKLNAENVLKINKWTLVLSIFFVVLWSSTSYGRSCGHLQGDFFENKNTVLIKMYLINSTILKST